MTRVLIFTLSILISLSLSAQEFEGEIIYRATYKSKSPKITNEQLGTMLGTRKRYFVKGGDYKTISNGTLGEWQLYIHSENRLYNKKPDSKVLLWNDGSIYDDPVLAIEINKNVTEILGYKCDELILTCKSGVQKYYFSSLLGVNHLLYEKHKYGNYDEYTSKAKALPLKLVIETKMFIMESVATEVHAGILDNELFTLPADVKMARRPS
jgi:hypothetical protein